MIWNKDSTGGNYVHYERSLVLTHTHAVKSSCIYSSWACIQNNVWLYSKCLFLTISLVWKLPKPGKQKPFSTICEERELP